MQASLRRTWQRLQHLTTRFGLSANTEVTQQPLLRREDLLVLYQRVQALLASERLAPEVIQRQQGEQRSIYRGSGLDYEESRAYQPGDEFRFMNWRVTARTGVMHMKVFREERRPGVVVLLDRRAAMRFGTRMRLKVTQAVRCAAVAGFMAQVRQASFTAFWLDTQLHGLDPVTQEEGMFHVLHSLAEPCPPVFTPVHELHLSQALHRLNTMLTPGSRVILISDFRDLDSSCRGELLHLAARHDVQAVQITDAAELNLPSAGELYLRDFVRRDTTRVDSQDAVLRENYRRKFSECMQSIKHTFQVAGIHHVAVDTQTDQVEREMLLAWR